MSKSKLIPGKKVNIKELANELWIIPTVLFGFLLMIQSLHLHEHYKMEMDVDSHCHKIMRNKSK